MFKTTGISIGIALFALVVTQAKADDTASTNAVASTNRALRATSRDTNAPRHAYADTNAAPKDADNTGRNVRDRSDSTLTPGDQGNNKSDLETTKQIRRALTKDDQFSTTAKNIKIITANGKVTLRGPVKSAEERQKILSIVRSVAGGNSVDNQLEVKASNQ
jgi:hypothetical protein